MPLFAPCDDSRSPSRELAADGRLSTVEVVLCGKRELALFVIIVAAQDD
jgi:hypothetical protein